MLVPSVDFNPRTYKQSHTPIVVQGGVLLPLRTHSVVTMKPCALKCDTLRVLSFFWKPLLMELKTVENLTRA